MQNRDIKKAPTNLFVGAFLFAQHGQTPEGLKEILTPNQKEVNATASALLATAGCEGSLSKYAEHSASEPKLA